MTASRLLSYGVLSEVAATGELYMSRRPDIWGHVQWRDRKFRWWLTKWKTGRRLAEGSALTPWGAWGQAYRASQRPGIEKAVAR